MRESGYVATQRAGDIFLYAFRKHVCNAMSRGLLVHEYFELFLVLWRVRGPYATDIDNHQTKERFMHKSFELLHLELR